MHTGHPWHRCSGRSNRGTGCRCPPLGFPRDRVVVLQSPLSDPRVWRGANRRPGDLAGCVPRLRPREIPAAPRESPCLRAALEARASLGQSRDSEECQPKAVNLMPAEARKCPARMALHFPARRHKRYTWAQAGLAGDPSEMLQETLLMDTPPPQIWGPTVLAAVGEGVQATEPWECVAWK